LFANNISAANTIMAATNDPGRILAMAEKLFPDYFKLQELEDKMEKLTCERASLSNPKVRASHPILR
jgi:hypothetical protein